MLFYQRIIRQIILAKCAGLGAKGVKRTAERADDAYRLVFLLGIIARETAGVFRAFDVVNAVAIAVGDLF